MLAKSKNITSAIVRQSKTGMASGQRLAIVNEESKHRHKLPLYDLHPKTENNWIAPNATVIGEVTLRRWVSVWYNAVIRGDINGVDINNFTSIGDNTVIHTAASLPTGMPAKVHIGRNCTIGAGCTIYSAHIEDDVVIGDKSVILEGARLESGCEIAPGSVVPPGRLIPAKQLWGGNPVQFIKDLDIGEAWSNYTRSYVNTSLAETHKNEFTLWNSAYLERDATLEDVHIEDQDLSQQYTAKNYYRGVVKYYA